MMISTVWILWVLVFNDGVWRAWEHVYTSQDACEEVRQLITYRREDKLIAVCRSMSKSERGSSEDKK